MRPLWIACILTLTLLSAGLGGCQRAGGGAANFMQTLFPPSPAQVAREAFNVYDPDRRRRAVNTLATAPWGGEGPYLRTYRLLVDDPDPTVRAACLRALGRHGHPSDVDRIVPYLLDETSFVRWEAAMALERLHHPDAIDPLVRVLRDDDDGDVRLAAARALGQYSEERVFDALVGALHDRQYSVVRQAERSLTLLTGESLGDSAADWLAWQEEHYADLFDAQRSFHYQEFIRPPGVLDYVQFWREHPRAHPRQPTGLEGTERVQVAEGAPDVEQELEDVPAELPGPLDVQPPPTDGAGNGP